MSKATLIEYLDVSWNPMKGCSLWGSGHQSVGCEKCWSERMAARFARPGEVFEGLTVGGKWSGLVRLYPHELIKPVWWTRPRCVGVSFMGDMFNQEAEWRDQAAVFGAMLMAPQHQFLLLTKAPDRIRKFMECLNHPSLKAWCDDQLISPELGSAQFCVEVANRKTAEPAFDYKALKDTRFPPKNVWAGTSVENQKWADRRLESLAAVPGFDGRRWVSIEPMLEPITVKKWLPFFDFVVLGGESGPGHRPMDLDWARSIRDECFEAEVPFFFKQTAGKKYIPKDLRVRQLPLSLEIV